MPAPIVNDVSYLEEQQEMSEVTDKMTKQLNLVTPEKARPASPSSSISDTASIDDSSSSSSSSGSTPTNDSSSKHIVVSEHKRAELDGLHDDEPLLKDNPNRFVLFPIQHPDVSTNPLYNHDGFINDELFYIYVAETHVCICMYWLCRCGKCIKRRKHRFGRRRKLIWHRIYKIGRD